MKSLKDFIIESSKNNIFTCSVVFHKNTDSYDADSDDENIDEELQYFNDWLNNNYSFDDYNAIEFEGYMKANKFHVLNAKLFHFVTGKDKKFKDLDKKEVKEMFKYTNEHHKLKYIIDKTK